MQILWLSDAEDIITLQSLKKWVVWCPESLKRRPFKCLFG